MNTTADSNLTKRALAAAMKELMEQMPFSKISVSDIAEQCGMNRKSFYYHFKDKYDLVNWIFDMEYLQLSSRQDYAGIWDFLTELCSFFYENRSFYRRALRIEGQNSFLEHFKEVLEPSIKYFLASSLEEAKYQQFCINFYADAFIAAFVRWLSDKDCVPPQEFVRMLKVSIYAAVKRVEAECPRNRGLFYCREARMLSSEVAAKEMLSSTVPSGRIRRQRSSNTTE